MPKFDRLEKDINTDTLIVGGGICGILTAYMLDSLGVDYVLVEADEICNKTTANTTAKITSQHGLIYSRLTKEFNKSFAKKYYEANEGAIKEYDILCENIDCDYVKTSSYVYSTIDDVNILKEAKTLNCLGINAEYKKICELPFEIRGALEFKNQRKFNPLKFLAHISRGLNIYEHTRVCEIEKTTAFTDGYSINANKIIIATHFPFINKYGMYYLKMFQERSYVIALKDAPHLENVYLDESNTGLSFRSYGKHLLLGGSSHRTGKECSGWLPLENAARKYFPNAKITNRWATQDCITLDSVPYVGKYSAFAPNIYVATGFNKWGMSSSMAAAKLLSELITKGAAEYEEIFSPTRTVLRPQLAKNTFEAMRGWLTFGHKRCSHLGCALTWNKHERTWDCSCHGSRFDKNGNLIDNPSTKDLNN